MDDPSRQRVRRDADPGIADADDDLRGCPGRSRGAIDRDADGDASAAVGVLHRVVQEVGKGLRHAREVDLHPDRVARYLDPQQVSGDVDERLGRFDRALHDEAQIDPLAPDLDLVVGDARDIQTRES